MSRTLRALIALLFDSLRTVCISDPLLLIARMKTFFFSPDIGFVCSTNSHAANKHGVVVIIRFATPHARAHKR